MWMILGIILACTSKLPPPPSGTDDGTTTGGSEHDTAGTSQTADTADTVDTADVETDSADTQPTDDTAPSDSADTAPPVLSCPPEMSGVTDGGDLLYCIDTWEVVLSDDEALGDGDQYAEGAALATATAASLSGALPSKGITYGQAATVCANTPVLNSASEVVGYKHLATVDEWRDSADGEVGEGGTTYPYGNTFDGDACACFAEDGTQQYDDYFPTESFPACVSDFGVYDQSGNLFEWADPEQSFDVSGWLGASGLVDVEGYLGATAELGEVFIVLGAGVDYPVTLGEDGRYHGYLTRSSWDYQFSFPIAQLALTAGGRYDMLPIELVPVDVEADETDALVRIMHERDGHPITEKMGGAYYVGDCDVTDGDLSHHHSFDGTIGFRCAAPPVIQ